ncbi:Protein ROOT HAIR DEFECTIVE 3 [Tetrabaena socialis]|uniref:Protein ROOT HAIR DEFECTIVE 3 homolog n=1 Tax=Tetrabaena socialis TaxID=47790 RepID=A0A2J8A6K2_9CHLO|nr:Protein ROOT HAIR DEFECTIVE 3 [Tetrabaena socialis]|eukprot:PNH08156.1 Protein ROOT HAIR DEFECTIVE 3 [Tetrabaena socialis]
MTEIVQVINGEGGFEQQSLQTFVDDNELASCKTNYQVVAIMGPQSSGKSTLLNHVFGTSFRMMDAMAGRGQTTKGIWLSKSPKVTETAVLVMDLEGSDGRERGEDDTNFERQSALFALAVADVLLVNIWCHDIGREQGAGKPLLRTIFQVNLKLFAPEPDRKRTVLLFVVRDKTKTPLPKLVEVLEGDLERMWDSISKPQAYEGSKLTDFFEVQYAALSHFEERYEDFQADAVHLRRRFSPDGDETLIRNDEKLPGDVFALSIRNIWEVIRSQKDLNLPAHKVMVANVRCQEIMEDQLRSFAADQAWTSLQAASSCGVVEGFGALAHNLLDSCVRGYEAEALYFDAAVREAKHEELTQRLLAALQPVYQAQVAAHLAATMVTFEKELKLALSSEGGPPGGFVAAAAGCRAAAASSFAAAYAKHLLIEGLGWDGAAEAATLAEALDAHILRIRTAHVAAAVARAEKQMASLVSGPVIALLESCAPGVWPRLHGVCRQAAAAADKYLKQALEGYGLSAAEAEALSAQLRAKAVANMEGHVREAALTRLSRMKDRFQEVFSVDEAKAPRMWGARDDIPTIAQKARLAAASVLSQLAVMRLPPDAPGASGAHHGEAVDAAVLRLAEATPAAAGAAPTADGDAAASSSAPPGGPPHPAVDVLSAGAWPGVDESLVLLHPHEVRTTWREFVSNSNVLVQQALSAQQANRLANSRMPPLWALAAMLVLGWNEAMALLFSPLYLVLGVVAFLFLRSLYTELDVEREMGRGALPGALSLSHKFLPACQAVIRKTKAAFNDMMQTVGEQDARAAAQQGSGGRRGRADGGSRGASQEPNSKKDQ